MEVVLNRPASGILRFDPVDDAAETALHEIQQEDDYAVFLWRDVSQNSVSSWRIRTV